MENKQPKLRLLLVDDEPEFLAATARALEWRGIQVSTADSGECALDCLRKSEFDVVVSDLKMPDMQGDVLFRMISRQCPDLPVIILTGHGTSETVNRLSGSGLFNFLSKPCDVEVLHRVVRQSVNPQWRRWLHRLRHC